ncbi:hypothetical protein C0J52_09727 [Blattella germanica]|nr:hypothetical protein C0J52_09727 [Blattella germanica]
MKLSNLLHDFHDSDWARRPRTSTDERSVKLVADVLEKNRRVTCEELSEATGISPTSVHCILAHDLKKRKISVRWVPHCLMAEPKTCANTDGKCCRILLMFRTRVHQTLTCSQN